MKVRLRQLHLFLIRIILLKKFKSVTKIRKAALKDLMTVDGINEKIAKEIKSGL